MTTVVRKVVVQKCGRNGTVIKRIVIGVAQKAVDVSRFIASLNKRRRPIE